MNGRTDTISAVSRRITILEPEGDLDPWGSLADDVRLGLAGPVKELPPKYFYDARGSRLFERITELPEYYQTRTERRILRRCAPAIIDQVRPRALVEFGSGSASKTQVLLDAMQEAGCLEGYGAIEVSGSALRMSALELVRRYPELEVVGVVGDFEHPVDLPFGDRNRLILFLGSTIGNLTSDQAQGFLSGVSVRMNPGDGFLVGFDLVKDAATLEAAYDDASGVTARFNLNVLRVINRRLDADFDLDGFAHRALYEEADARIEMHLVSRRSQRVRIGALDMSVPFEAGESIRTELSHKYTRETATSALDQGGFRLLRWETDPDEKFALALAHVSRAAAGG